VFRDESKNCTVSGTFPEEVFDINDATGTAPRAGLVRNIPVIRRRNSQTTIFVFIPNHPMLFFTEMN
jgi:hypothetical protein